jgi:hypothetical protein
MLVLVIFSSPFGLGGLASPLFNEDIVSQVALRSNPVFTASHDFLCLAQYTFIAIGIRRTDASGWINDLYVNGVVSVVPVVREVDGLLFRSESATLLAHSVLVALDDPSGSVVLHDVILPQRDLKINDFFLRTT